MIEYYEFDAIDLNKVSFVLALMKFNNSWIWVRQKGADVWELPAGRKEEDETIFATMHRELYEETGVISYDLCYLGIVKVYDTFGLLGLIGVKEMGQLPESEIVEIKDFKEVPLELRYKDIQKQIFNDVTQYLERENNGNKESIFKSEI